jgi:hypothetical protein
VDARAAARRWVEAWDRGLRERDVDTIVSVYADDVAFRSHPFREPESVRGYAEDALGGLPWDCSFGEPIVDGDRASVEYVVQTSAEEIRGVSILRFRDDGLVAEHLDYWADAAPS